VKSLSAKLFPTVLRSCISTTLLHSLYRKFYIDQVYVRLLAKVAAKGGAELLNRDVQVEVQRTTRLVLTA